MIKRREETHTTWEELLSATEIHEAGKEAGVMVEGGQEASAGGDMEASA